MLELWNLYHCVQHLWKLASTYFWSSRHDRKPLSKQKCILRKRCGVHLSAIYMHCTRSSSRCSSMQGIYAQVLGGSICLWYLYVHWSLYILISWLFQMGEGVIWLWYLYVQWSVYILISWLFQMGEGGHLALVSICAVVSIYIDLPLHQYFLISWLFRMGSHWWHRSAKSSLLSLAVSNGGSTGTLHLKIWLPGHLGVLIKKVFLFCEDQ